MSLHRPLLALWTIAAQLRSVYGAIGLSVTAHKDGTLVLRWSCGTRTLPAITGSESPVLRRIYAPDDQ